MLSDGFWPGGLVVTGLADSVVAPRSFPRDWPLIRGLSPTLHLVFALAMICDEGHLSGAADCACDTVLAASEASHGFRDRGP